MQVIILWDQGRLSFIKERLLSDRIFILLFQILNRTLQTQNANGSWANPPSHEATCYAILTLTNLTSLPIGDSLQHILQVAVEQGRRFLNHMDQNVTEPDYLWIEKVTYRSDSLLQCYHLAALKASPEIHEFGDKIKAIFSGGSKTRAKFTKFYSQLPLFADTPQWAIESALIEGYLYLPQLKLVRLDVFPRKDMAEDKYFEYIPFTWTASNNLKKAFLNPSFLFDMMVISFLNYQADEYMEKVIGESFDHRLSDVREIIDLVFETITAGSAQVHAGVNNQHPNGSIPGRSVNEDIETLGPREHVKRKPYAGLENSDESVWTGGNVAKKICTTQTANGTVEQDSCTPAEQQNGAISLEHADRANGINGTSSDNVVQVYATLKRFVEHVLKHLRVQTASAYDQENLRRELKVFLLAHVDQIEDNSRLSLQATNPNTTVVFQSPKTTFFDWVRNTSANHTSCPYSFALVICFFGQCQDYFATAKEKYLAQAMCRHLATLCRMYNDYGSVARDRLERNLNGVNFPEFHDSASHEGKDEREQLFDIAAYERSCLELTLKELSQVTGELNMKVVEVFCDVTDMFGQIYVKKDIASRMKG